MSQGWCRRDGYRGICCICTARGRYQDALYKSYTRIEVQGISVADAAGGAGGDVTVREKEKSRLRPR